MERSPGEGNGYALQYSGLENSMDCTAQGHKESGTTEPLSLFMLVLLLVLETFLPFSTVTTPIYLFTSSVQGSLFSTSSPTFVICRLLDDGHSHSWGMISHCCLTLLKTFLK